MKKRKDKAKTQQQFLEMKAKQRKDFFNTLRLLCDLFDYPDLYQKLPQSELDFLFRFKVAAPCVVVAPGQKVPEHLVKKFKDYVPAILKMFPVVIMEGKPAIPLQALFTELFTIITLIPQIREDSFAEAPKVIEYFNNVMQDPYYIGLITNFIDHFLFSFSTSASSIDKEIVWIKDVVGIVEKTQLGRYEFQLHYHVPKTIQVELDGSKRPMYRVEWYLDHLPDVVQVLPSSFGIKSGDNSPMYVYVQAHALKRLDERIGITKGAMHAWMWHSFRNMTCTKVGENKYLVPYLLYEHKAGYFVCSVMGGKVIVRTFLFITNTGTPEYALLEAHTGLKQHDIDYLAINTLNDIIASDLLQNEIVKDIFVKAGCGSLLDLIGTRDFTQDRKASANAAHFLKYLEMEHQQDWDTEEGEAE